MEKIIFAFAISVIIGILASIFAIVLGINILNGIFIYFLISDTMIIGLYLPDIIADTNKNDLNYVFGYFIVSCLFYLIYIPYALIKNNTNKCIKCQPRIPCSRRDYDIID